MTTTPSGASITLNGSPLAYTTPYDTLVSPGDYTIVFSKSGYEDCTKSATVVADRTTNVDCTLVALPTDVFTVTVSGVASFPVDVEVWHVVKIPFVDYYLLLIPRTAVKSCASSTCVLRFTSADGLVVGNKYWLGLYDVLSPLDRDWETGSNLQTGS